MYEPKEYIRSLGIEEAERIITELKKEQELCTDEQLEAWFCDLTNGMTLRREPSRPGVLLWDKTIEGAMETFFEQDLRDDIVWCRHRYIWSVFQRQRPGKYTDHQALATYLLEKHLKWRVGTTARGDQRRNSMLEKHLKWRVGTTPTRRTNYNRTLEKHLKWRVGTTEGLADMVVLGWKSTSNGG